MTRNINRIVRMTVVAALVAALGLLFGCAKATPATTEPQQQSAAGAEASGPMTLKVVEPTPGAEVAAGTLTVAVETTGIKFVMPSNKLVAGEGHVHFTVDGGPVVMSTELQTEIKDVAPGAHTLKAELVQNDTTPFDPPVEQVVEFTAK